MRGGDDPHVDRDRARTSETFDRPLLQDAQQLHLDFERQVADFVEKDGRMVGQLKPANLPRQRAGERALFPAEQLAFDQSGRNRRAVHPDHRARVAGAELVDLRRKQFLARAGLPDEQDRRVGRRHLLDLLEDAPHGGTLSDDVGPAVSPFASRRCRPLELPAQLLDFAAPLPATPRRVAPAPGPA